MKFTKKIFSDITKLYNKANQLRKNIIEKANEHKKNPIHIRKIGKKKPQQAERMIVEFSLSSIAKATILILLLVSLIDFISYIQEPLFILGISLFLAAIIDPLVDSMEHKKIPRALGIFLIYILFIGIFVAIILNLVPILFREITEIASNIGLYVNNFFKEGSYPFAEQIQPVAQQILHYVEKVKIIRTFQDGLSEIGKQLSDIAGNTIGAIISIFSNLVNFIFILVVTFFIVIDKAGIKKFFLSLFPQKHANYISTKISVVQKKLGEWVRGQLLLCLSIAIVTFIGLSILGVNYAVTLAMVAGVTELIPYLGPIIAYIAVLPIAFNQSPLLVLWVTILYIIIQQLENNILVPIIMKRAVGLSPIAVLLAMLIGAKLLGILGIILAVPIATTVAIFIHDYAEKNEE